MMKYCQNLGFALIFRDKKVDSKIIKVFKRAFSLNKCLFKGRTPRKFKIVICDTEAEFRKQAKYYYRKEITATVLRNNTLVTRSLEMIGKSVKRKKESFQSIANHEMNHVFCDNFYNCTNKPIWLVEGFACHVGNNSILSKSQIRKLVEKYDVKPSILEYRYLRRNFKKGKYLRYKIWANFTRYLVRMFSDARIIRFMDEYIQNPTKRHYIDTFKSVFGFEDKYLFEKFIDSLG